MKLWIAYWLRKLAERIDGDEYARVLPVPSGGRFVVHKPTGRVKLHQLYDGCECDYWPGITGANGRITQHAVGCPHRPDTKGVKGQHPQAVILDEAVELTDGQVDRLTAAVIKEPAHNTRTGRFTVSKSNLEDCNCKTAQDFSDPHDMGVKHRPMCPQYKPLAGSVTPCGDRARHNPHVWVSGTTPIRCDGAV